MITLLLLLAAVAGFATLLIYVANPPDPLRRIFIGVAALLMILLVLSYFGILRSPGKGFWAGDIVRHADAQEAVAPQHQQQPSAVAISTSSPGLTRVELFAMMGPLLAMLLGLVGAGIAYARTVIRDRQLDIEDKHAERAAQNAQEQRLKEGKDGKYAEDIAVLDLKRRLPSIEDQRARDAIRAAVARLPGYGETGKLEPKLMAVGELIQPADKKDGGS